MLDVHGVLRLSISKLWTPRAYLILRTILWISSRNERTCVPCLSIVSTMNSYFAMMVSHNCPPSSYLSIHIPEFAFYVNKNGWRSRKEFMVFWEGSPTGFGEMPCHCSSGHHSYNAVLALHYPYVLAFEPTFVEIRHVETGLMSQVIQGNNLRLIFADTPPSTTNTASPVYYNPGPQQGYNPYPNPYASRQSLQSAYATPQNMGYPINHPRPAMQPFGRDEILIVSDDRVLTLRLATHLQQIYTSDTASMMSIPR